jgi:hypothetical protein
MKKDVTNNDIYGILENHFEDDRIAFGKISDRFDKNDEIAVQNGNHMSFIRKDLTEVNNKISKLTDTLSSHIKAVEPILTNYQDTQATYRTFARLARPVIVGIITLGSVISAWLVIKSF